ncbi:MAG: Spo0E family sporulation regulatory protein-aspartic acid phosphatase [Vallitaleaceae bacterium]|nr:Spo0E family sporulation regulatory protein-aspartic acid phosphatase [Vallitaleaceae bacterium]
MNHDQKIEDLRIKLGEMKASKECKKGELLKVSQEIDELIKQHFNMRSD